MCGLADPHAATYALRPRQHQQDIHASSRNRRPGRFVRLEMAMGTRRSHVVDLVHVDIDNLVDRLGRSCVSSKRDREAQRECQDHKKGAQCRGERWRGTVGGQCVASSGRLGRDQKVQGVDDCQCAS